LILDKFKLDGKAAIVTGASRGLGKSMAIALAQAGADVAGVGTSNMDETKNEIEQTNRKFLPIKADLLSPDAVDKIISSTLNEFGKIDILVNNAGIIRRAPVTEFTQQDWDDVIDVNLKSLFFLSKEAAKVFIKQQSGGKIINIASMLSYQGGILVASYTSSKSAVLGLTRLMANELAGKNINVNAIAPGYMATANTQALRDNEKRNKAILERIPAGRWGEPGDMMGAVVFLASQASDYMHGFTVAVDGGWLAR
jgi:2-deoxy-D-gluconate 3-dehydrogenase